MSDALQELSGETKLWIVGLNLDTVSGYTIWGEGESDRFLTSDQRLVVARSVPALVLGLPSCRQHPFEGEERFATFCKRVRDIDLIGDDAEGAYSGLFDFDDTVTALRERQVFWAPHSGMAVDCLGAALDLGWQYGEDSVGYQLARYGQLDILYDVIWGRKSEEELDFVECEAAFVRLVDWIEDLTR